MSEHEIEVGSVPPWLEARLDQKLANISEHNTPELAMAKVLHLAIVVTLDEIVVNDEHSHGHPCAKCGTVMGCDSVDSEADVVREHSSGVPIMLVFMFCKTCADAIIDEA